MKLTLSLNLLTSLMIRTILIIVFLAAGVSGQDTAFHLAIAGQVTDLITTEIALANGAQELNPLMTSQYVFVATKIGASVLIYVYHKYHPKDKWGMRMLAVISWIPTVYNLTQSMRQQGEH